MSKHPNQLDPYWETNQDQSAVQHHASKLPSTTRYTQPQHHFNLSNSFILGKNDLLENNTSSELDSSDAESDVSFQERLNCCHEKHLLQEIHKYLQVKAVIDPNHSFQPQSSAKSTQLMKDIEQRVFEEIKRSHGNNELEKIKLTIKFIKRNENLTKIYFEVVKSVPQPFQTTIFFLLKHSLMVYLQGRQSIPNQQNYINESVIKDFLAKNCENWSQELIKDQKLQMLFNPQKEQMLRKKYLEFLSQWLQGFFMAKEGYPCMGFRENKKSLNSRLGRREGAGEREKRKMIKKF